MRAACSSFAHALATRAKDCVGAKALLDVDDDAARRDRATSRLIRRPPAPARGRGGRAPPAAIVSSTRPCRRRPAKQQFSERLSQPCSPATHSASRSSSVRLAGSPTAIVGAGQVEQRGARGHPLDEQRRARCTPGSTRPLYSAANAVSRPVRAHRRLLEGHLLLLARVRRVVGGHAVDRRRRAAPRSAPARSASVASGGCIFMRVSMLAHVLLGEQQVVRARPPR